MELIHRIRRTKELRREQLAENNTEGRPMEAPAVELQKLWLPSVEMPPMSPHGYRVAVLPDVQAKPGAPTHHLAAYGKYIAAKRPEIVICIGDFWDFPSLSTYALAGTLEAEGARYVDDLAAGHRAMEAIMDPIAAAPGYDPLKIFTVGNHEDRAARAVNRFPRELQGVIGEGDLRLDDYGWHVVPFLQPAVIGGTAFCHYFPSGPMGRPINTAQALLRKMHMSCFAGHLQGRDIAFSRRADGQQLTGIISGSFYMHDESYISPLGNQHWRGAWFLHEVKGGQYDPMALSLNYLLRRWGSR